MPHLPRLMWVKYSPELGHVKGKTATLMRIMSDSRRPARPAYWNSNWAPRPLRQKWKVSTQQEGEEGAIIIDYLVP